MNHQDPRELAGPFIVLGVDKDVDNAALEARYQLQRAAIERGVCRWSVEDLDWARQVLLNPKQRLAADLDSLNPDLASGEVHRLQRLYHLDGSPPGWEPLDPEPPVELPDGDASDAKALIASVAAPEMPIELPTIDAWLQQFAAAVTDPWTMELAGN